MKLTSGETFDKILENIKLKRSEIIKIKKALKKKINLKSLNINQKFQFTIDQSS